MKKSVPALRAEPLGSRTLGTRPQGEAGRRGSALLIIILILALFSILAGLFTKIVYNVYASTNAALEREQAFYLAEAGIEKGKVELAHNPNWYTDLPQPAEDDAEWLISSAVGQATSFGEGRFKIVRERDKDRLYSAGFKGKGVVVLKVTFSKAPFKILSWEEL